MMKATRLLMRRQVLPRVLLQQRTTRVLSAASAPHQQTLPHEDVVRTAIQKMMEGMHETTTTTRIVSQEDLDRSLQYFQNQLQEARHCIADCKEQDCNFEEEFETANAALEQAQVALVDWLDDLRQAGDERGANYKAVREAGASSIKNLRKELDELHEMQ